MTKRKRKKFDFVPDVLRPTAERLHDLGYDITYLRKVSDCEGDQYSAMHVLDGASSASTKIQIKIHTTSGQDRGLLELYGSLAIQGGGNTPFAKIRTIDGLWRFAEMDGLCWCGKDPFTEEFAKEVLREALVRRVLLRQSRRKETRYYRCESWGGVYHLTSQETYAGTHREAEES